MRDKIVDIITDPDSTPNEQADQILALICGEIGKGMLTDEETDKCTPSSEQLEAFLAEPDDEVAAELKASDPDAFRIIGRCILYGRNIRQAQLNKALALFQWR